MSHQKQKLEVLLEELKHSFNNLAQKIKDLENEINASFNAATGDEGNQGGDTPPPPDIP